MEGFLITMNKIKNVMYRYFPGKGCGMELQMRLGCREYYQNELWTQTMK